MKKWNRYQQSKRANLAFTYALADYIEKKKSKVLSLCAHPGATNSGLQSRTQADVGVLCVANCTLGFASLLNMHYICHTRTHARTHSQSFMDRFVNGLAVAAGHSTDDGLLGLAYAALKEDVKNGDFFGPEKINGKAVLLPCEREKDPGYPKDQLDMLWTKSVEATGAKWDN